MAYYLVRAKLIEGKMEELRERLSSGEIRVMRPFGTALDYSLNNARVDNEGIAVWEEEDYCSPPLAMERSAVLDTYFTDLTVKAVTQGDGWSQLQGLTSLWQEQPETD